MEFDDQVVRVSTKSAEISAQVMLKIMGQVTHILGKAVGSGVDKITKANIDDLSGELSLSELKSKGELESIPVDKSDLRDIRKTLKDYGVDFSVHRDRNTKEYVIFFTGKDVKQVNEAIKNFLKSDKVLKRKVPMKEQFDKAEKEADKRNKAREAERSQERDKNRNRGDR